MELLKNLIKYVFCFYSDDTCVQNNQKQYVILTTIDPDNIISLRNNQKHSIITNDIDYQSDTEIDSDSSLNFNNSTKREDEANALSENIPFQPTTTFQGLVGFDYQNLYNIVQVFI